MKRVFLTAVLLSTVFLLSVPFQRAQADSNFGSQYTLPVSLSTTDPTTYHIAGYLCYNNSLQDKTVQLLVHGFTYNHLYWNFPYPNSNAADYSYVQSALGAGYATFSID